MGNEQVKELLDMVMALPKSENYNMQFTYDNEDNHVQVFLYGKKRCECCGRIDDVSDLKSSLDYDIIKKFIEKWRGIIEKENENDRGNN